MSSLIRSLFSRPSERAETYTLDDYVEMLRNAGLSLQMTMNPEREEIAGDFTGLVQGAYRSNGVVFACMVARMHLFNQARFQWQQLRGGQPGDLFGTEALSILERPEPTKTTGDLLTRAIGDADLAGNWFGVRRGNRVKRLRPDWCYLVMGSADPNGPDDPNDVDAEVVGLVYTPGGPYSGNDPQTFLVGTFAHFAPIPDPLAQYRGMSWLTPVIRNIRSHGSATTYKGKFFENAATPNLLVKFPVGLTKEKAGEWIEIFEQEHSGALNAFRTAYLGGGADATPVGSSFDKLDLKSVQGADETVIAAAARVHPVIVGLSEGMQGSSLNAGNYSTIKRQFGDGTIRPLWQSMAGSLEDIVPPPRGAQLWYDDKHIPFLAEDLKDAAEVFAAEAQAVRTLWDGGAIPASAIAATAAKDIRLVNHSGFLSVQMQPVTGAPPEDEEEPVAARGWAQVHTAMQSPGLPVTIGGQYTARESFWPVHGPAHGLHVEQGTVLDPDHYLVRAFPTMFERSVVIEGTAVRVGPVRCSGCDRFLAEIATPPYRLRCRDCKAWTEAA